MTAVCSSVGGNWPSAAAMTAADRVAVGDGCRHDALTAPIVWMRHRPYENSSRQCSS